MDRNSVISGGTDASDRFHDVNYTWAKAVAGRNAIRKSTMVMPEGASLERRSSSPAGGAHGASLIRPNARLGCFRAQCEPIMSRIERFKSQTERFISRPKELRSRLQCLSSQLQRLHLRLQLLQLRLQRR